MSGFDYNKFWIGHGAKVGGIIVVAGMEGVDGKIHHTATGALYNFNLTSVRLGFGLGASAGEALILIFDCDNPYVRLHDTEVKDWGINISMAGSWAKVAKFLKDGGFWLRIGKLGLKGARHLRNIELIRNDLSYIYNMLDLNNLDGKPKVIILDTPLGAGLELSAVYTEGKITISYPD